MKLNRQSSVLFSPYFAVSILIVSIVAAYWPSLFHIPRGDHWAYLIDVMDSNGFFDLLSKSYSYNRTRLIAPGDTDLFRPVLFFLLASERFVFGNTLFLYQLVGIALHIGVTLLTFILFFQVFRIANPNKEIDPLHKLLGFIVVAFFGLNIANIEMVVWGHLHGYLLFHIFVLSAVSLSLYLHQEDIVSKVKRTTLVFLVWFLALLSAFTYELGQGFVILLGIFWAIPCLKQRRNWKAISLFMSFFLIVIIYQVSNALDWHHHNGSIATTGHTIKYVLNKSLHYDTIRNSVRFLGYGTLHPIFPSLARIAVAARITVGELRGALFDIWAVVSGFVVLCWVLLSLVGVKRLIKSSNLVLKSIVILLAGLFAGYLAFNVLGRLNLVGKSHMITSNSYYAYFPFSYFLLISIILWGFTTHTSKLWLSKLKIGLIVALTTLAIVSGVRVFSLNSIIRHRQNDVREVLVQVNKFIKNRTDGEFLRISFDQEKSDPIPSYFGIPFTTILFRDHEDHLSPTHIGVIKYPNVKFYSASDYNLSFNTDKKQLHPQLVEFNSMYNVNLFEGTYYGTLNWDSLFDPNRSDYYYSIESNTLDGARAAIPQMVRKRQEDLKKGILTNYIMATVLSRGEYKKFYMTQFQGVFYAHKKDEGTFFITNKNYNNWFSARSVAHLKEKIDHWEQTHK